jgi:hypothetical protein
MTFFVSKLSPQWAGGAFIVYSQWHPSPYLEDMNSKFCGNSLDLWKYDLLTFILTHSRKLSLFYIPMITEPLLKERNMKYITYELGRRNKTLFKLMQSEFAKEYSDINVIKSYFVNQNIHLSILNPDVCEDGSPPIYFREENRKNYFEQAVQHYRSLVNKTLVFVDPDVGSDVGITRRFRSNKNMYVRKQELIKVKGSLKSGDFIGFFQHLGNSNYTIERRLKDLQTCFGDWVLFTGYARIQAGIVFIFNDEATYIDKRKLILEYFRQYDDLKHRDKFIIQGKPPQTGGFSAL